MTTIVGSLSEIADDYDAAFVDLWGCVHNGVKAHPDAVVALQDFRAAGKRVILMTNAPRAAELVQQQFARLGVPDDAFDGIATSGDSARTALFEGLVGDKVWFIGQADDLAIFEPPGGLSNPKDIVRVPFEQAEGIVCCGPEDPLADPALYRGRFLHARERGMKLICANPDLVVDRGDRREYCAGTLAQLYTEMGGESLYFGKPHPMIYELARRRLSAVGGGISGLRILAIGDGIHTDILGAQQEDIDSIFVTGGLAAEQTRTQTDPDPEALEHFLAKAQVSSKYAMGFLR